MKPSRLSTRHVEDPNDQVTCPWFNKKSRLHVGCGHGPAGRLEFQETVGPFRSQRGFRIYCLIPHGSISNNHTQSICP